MDDAAADRKCEYVALLSSGSIVIGSHCLLPFGNETPSVGIAFPRPFARLWCAAAAYILVCRRRVHARCDADHRAGRTPAIGSRSMARRMTARKSSSFAPLQMNYLHSQTPK